MMSLKSDQIFRIDLRMLVDKLRKIYGKNRRRIEYTLFGEPIFSPYPIIRLRNKIIRGYPISDSRLHYLEFIPHRHRVFTLDSSLKMLFNLGPYKIIIAKIVAGIWRGFNKIVDFNPIMRINMVENRREAAEWLLRIELEAFLNIVDRIGFNDYCILDRGLMALPAFKKSTRELIERLDKIVSAKGGILVGISKASQLSLNTGQGLLGYLVYFANKRLPKTPWYYYPIFRTSSLPSWYIGDICVVKFSHEVENVFRIDVSRNSLYRTDIKHILGEIAFLQDPGIPGYPYPVKSVHDEAKIGRDEYEIFKHRFMEILEEEGILKQFLADIDSVSFREKFLLGDFS